jgi:hypothetical protein
MSKANNDCADEGQQQFNRLTDSEDGNRAMTSEVITD